MIYILEQALRVRSKSGHGEGVDVDAQVAARRKFAGQWKSDVDLEAESRRLFDGSILKLLNTDMYRHS